MIDDVIGNIFDKDGHRIELSMKDCYKTYLDVVTLLYHDYMIRIVDGDFSSFKKMHMKATSRMIDLVHNRYADHVDGIRMEFLKRTGVKDLRKDPLN